MYAFKLFVFTKHEARSKARPKARSGHRIACDQNNLYSYGGFNPCISDNDPDMQNDRMWIQTRPLFKELWKFNLVTNRWKRLPCQKSMPKELASNAVVLKGGALIIYGGTGVPFGYSCSNRLYICDLKDGEIQKVPAKGDMPKPQYGQAIVCHGPYLYTIGGTSGFEYTCDIHRCDLRTGIWESVYICAGKNQCEPVGRYRHELAFDGRMIYVLGGGTSTESFGFSEISAFDLKTNGWVALSAQGEDHCNAVPEARRCHGSVQYTDEKSGVVSVVISGGYDGTRIFDDVWKLNLRTLRWTCLRECILPRPVYFHSTALTPDGRMYTFGGIAKLEEDSPERTADVHSVWLTIPSLTEICWQAINYYNTNLQSRSTKELLCMGIPLKFVQRIESDDQMV